MSKAALFPILILIGSQAVTGCVSTPTEATIGSPPAKYVDIAREHLRTSLFDPYSARDFQIAQPRPGQMHLQGTFTHESGWVVCYRGKAKNRMGAYTGVKEAAILIRDDRVVASNQDSDHYEIRTNCRDAKYEPLSLS